MSEKLYDWIYDPRDDGMHCECCGSKSSCDKFGNIETPFCGLCGARMNVIAPPATTKSSIEYPYQPYITYYDKFGQRKQTQTFYTIIEKKTNAVLAVEFDKDCIGMYKKEYGKSNISITAHYLGYTAAKHRKEADEKGITNLVKMVKNQVCKYIKKTTK